MPLSATSPVDGKAYKALFRLIRKALLTLLLLFIPLLWLTTLIWNDYQKIAKHWNQVFKLLNYREVVHNLVISLWLEAEGLEKKDEVRRAFRELAKWEPNLLAPQLSDLPQMNVMLPPLFHEWENLYNKTFFYTTQQRLAAYQGLITPLLRQLNQLEPLLLLNQGDLTKGIMMIQASDPLNLLRLTEESLQLSDQLKMQGSPISPYLSFFIEFQALGINNAVKKIEVLTEESSLKRRFEQALEFYVQTLNALVRELQDASPANQSELFFETWPTLLPPWHHAQELLMQWIKLEMQQRNQNWAQIAGITLILFVLAMFGVFVIFHQFWRRLKLIVYSLEELSKERSSVHLAEGPPDALGYMGKLINQIVKDKQAIKAQSGAIIDHLKQSTNAFIEAIALQQGNLLQQEQIAKQVGLAAEEIGAKTHELILSTERLSQVIREASALALGERQELSDLETIIERLLKASTAISQLLQNLNQETLEVSSVSSSLVSLTDQSYLLALNTSLEASRNSEVSSGFAVIAQEIHRLTDQAAVVTLDIERRFKVMIETFVNNSQQIEGFTGDIRAGEAHSARVRDRLSQLLDKVQFIGGAFERMQEGVKQQVADAAAIAKMAQTLTQVTQQALNLLHQWQETMQNFSSNLQQLQQKP